MSTKTTTTAEEVGTRLVQMWRNGKNHEAIDEFYTEDVVSVEATPGPDGERRKVGIEAVHEKNRWWDENHEVHDASIRGPFTHGHDRFCVIFEFDVTHLPDDERHHMKEVALYQLTDGKITKEEFFYEA